MKLLKPLLLVLAVGLLPATHAQKAPPPVVTSPGAQAPVAPERSIQQTEPPEAQLEAHRHYVNKAGQSVHSPTKSKDGSVPAGASAQCRDGTYSFSRSRRGTCSRHGGIASWM